MELPTFQGKDAGYWLAQYASQDRAARRAAQLALRASGTESISVLGYLLSSDDEFIRQRAEQTLSAIGVPAVPGILAFFKDENPLVRMHAARLLAALQPADPDVTAALMAALDDRDERVVADAAYALANCGAQAAPAIDALARTMQHRNPRIRITAAEALAAIGPLASPVVPSLVDSLRDPDFGVRRAAAQAIGCIGPPASPTAINALIELLASREPYVRMAAATALGKMGPTAKRALSALQIARDDPTVGAEAGWAAAKIIGDAIESPQPHAVLPNASPSLAIANGDSSSRNWPMLAGNPSRNAVATANLPTDWDPELGLNVLWQVGLGNTTFAGPVVADGRVYIGTDNGLKRNRNQPDRQGLLVAFSAADGTFLWQDAAPDLVDRGLSGALQQYTTSTPLVEGNRLYYVTAQAQIRCLDVEAFADNQNDGPWTAETAVGPHDADLVWEIDMGIELGVYPHEAPNCSIAAVGDLLMVGTSNGVDVTHTGTPAPRAPSFIGVDKTTGKVVWQVVGPSPRLLHGQWSSPSIGQLGDRVSAFFGGGDGWLYALDPMTGRERWRYDGNPKHATWRAASDSGETVFRNNIIACPVFHDGHVLLAMGQDPTHGDGQGLLHKIRCDGWDDVTTSHTAWQNHDVHRTIASPIIHEGLVYVGDNYGQVHCLDLATGEQRWMHDQFGPIWGCMVLAGQSLYVGDEDGNLTIYRAGHEKQIIGSIQMPAALYAQPAVAEETLFLATSQRLYAIKQESD